MDNSTIESWAANIMAYDHFLFPLAKKRYLGDLLKMTEYDHDIKHSRTFQTHEKYGVKRA